MASYVGLESSGHVLLEDGTSGLLTENVTSIKTGVGIAGYPGIQGVTFTKAGYSTVGLVARGIGLLNADEFLKAGYAVLAGVGNGRILIQTEYLRPAGEHDLVLLPELDGSFALTPSAPGSFALTPLEEEDFVLTNHPDLDSG